MLTFTTPLTQLYGVGPARAKALKKIGLATIQDLIFYFPFRYEDWSKQAPLDALPFQQKITVRVKIESIQNFRTPRRGMILTRALLQDGRGQLEALWFNQPFLTQNLRPGQDIFLSGEVGEGATGPIMKNPEYERVSSRPIHTARIVPQYNVTAGLTPKWLRYLVSRHTQALITQVPEYLPAKIITQYHLLGIKQALAEIHFPTNQQCLAQARERLAFDEFFLLQCAVLKVRRKLQAAQAPPIPLDVPLARRFIQNLPFKLTEDQRRAAWEILQDLQKTRPANRLLEGDVGSGKTVVAALAMLAVAKAGYQAVLMAPTEILAQQHYHTLAKILKPFALKLGLQTGTRKLKPQAPLLIGTHALIKEKMRFGRLGLVIIDEQHRFGVKQRMRLKNKATGLMPHFISMTATPIPRSLALTLYGDLDISLIRHLPPGRKKTITRLVPPQKREDAYVWIKKRLAAGEQAFVVCPLIEESDKLGVKAATQEYKRLSRILSAFRLGLLHSRLKPKIKERVMRDFKAGKLQVLVATAVVEVGIDVPEASIILIESAERFGLASLHQLRGRVGRGHKQSYCFLFTETKSAQALKRLRALTSAQDGFALAEYDLEFRGPGEIYGTRQSGYLDLKVGSLLDYALIQKAREAAQAILHDDAALQAYPLLKRKVEQQITKISLE